jgi:hypothetical protein
MPNEPPKAMKIANWMAYRFVVFTLSSDMVSTAAANDYVEKQGRCDVFLSPFRSCGIL